MRKLFLALQLIFLISIVYSQNEPALRQKIVPLQTTRPSIEKFAKFVKNLSNFTRYETENEFIDVYFTETKCIGDGWNVPKGRVLTYRLYPKRELLFNEIAEENRKLFRTADDTGTSHYINANDGIVFTIRPGERKIEYIKFFPTLNDSSLRCKGFPKFDLISEYYSPTQTFSVKNIAAWDEGLMANTFGQLRDDKNLKGYAYVYCKRGEMAKCNKLKKIVERYAGRALGGEAARFAVSVGGYRNGTEIEVFLIPDNFPPVVAQPIYPSNF